MLLHVLLLAATGPHVPIQPPPARNLPAHLARADLTYPACVDRIERTVAALKCTIPPEYRFPPRDRKAYGEYAMQLAAKSRKVDYERLNALVSLTQNAEGRKKLAGYFTGLACAGLPQDPIGRKNWRDALPPCPDKAPSGAPWVKDPAAAIRRFHPGAASCWRLAADRPANCPKEKAIWECIGGKWLDDQPPAIAEILKRHPPAQQCCFAKTDRLIASGAGAGTPDTVFSSHVLEDLVDVPPGEDPPKETKLQHLKDRLEGASAALDHNILDARIIPLCLPDWPGKDEADVETYHLLGWGPKN